MAEDEHNVAAAAAESMVEIHIKTLDSHLFTFRVHKNMLVSAFKEKIANDVGLPVGQQRLIFRGKVLKDEHPLSQYHIETGHTLHLVARHPSESQPSSASSTNTNTTANATTTGQDPNAPGSRPRVAHVSHSVVLGTFAGGDQNVGGSHDISRVISAVLDSFGVRDASVTVPQPNMQFNIPRQAAQGNEAGTNVNNQGQPGNPSQSVPQGMQIPLGAAIAIPTLATPIPDSLHTLSEFMSRMEQALSHNAATGVNLQARGVDNSTGSENQASAAATGVNLQARGIDDSTRSENQAATVYYFVNPGQPEGSESKSEGQKDTEGTVSTAPSISAVKSTNESEGASSSNSINDNSGSASTVPLGLGLGGLQPKRRSRSTKPEASASVPPANASTSNPAGGQLNSAAIMNEVIASPALDGLLSGVSSQTGIGSPDVLRNMLGQLTQNPAMMNTVNQIAQQIDGNQDLSNMFAGMGGPRGSSGGSGGGGGFDLSSMVQQMMPIVAQAFGGGGSGSNMFQQPASINHEPHSTTDHDISSDSQANLEDLVEKIEQQESADDVFSSVVEAAAHLNDNAAGISEICIEEGLAHEFMEMLKRDVSRRAEEEGG
ncbi:hypothetical protein M8C21_014798 [Ambrosia artemisiifolia]|uniref:Ubiquitin-like domain-containing protein n=1 Tax=Ambrosia artemisiifolia TaxID=4212 RepID=A0AAD5BNH8_AMBAR|nr:hypothetical protein M8C21_014798 [Ambrosia artemisiifolia]